MRHGEVYLPNGVDPNTTEAAKQFLILLTDPDQQGKIVFGITRELHTPHLITPGCHGADYYISPNARSFCYGAGLALDNDNIKCTAEQNLKRSSIRLAFTVSSLVIGEIHRCARKSPNLERALTARLFLSLP